MFNRREFVCRTGGAFAWLALGHAHPVIARQSDGREGRLLARPSSGVKTTTTRQQMLDLGDPRPAILRVPPNAGEAPIPLLVLFHGLNSTAERVLTSLGSASDDAGVAVLVVKSSGRTWDTLEGGFGPDVVYINRALERAFAAVSVDSTRLAVGGHSAGASYALAIGPVNGDLFSHVIAIAPFVLPALPARGRPRFFVAHGRQDDVVPIDRSRYIVPQLRERGLDVTYREFDGYHEMPPDTVREAMSWLVRRNG